MRSEHAKAYRKLYQSKLWKRLRHDTLVNEPFCQMKACGKIANVVDHIKPHKGDIDLFYATDNLQSLCKPCHDQHKQRFEKRGFDSDVDSDGWPTDPKHPANQRFK